MKNINRDAVSGGQFHTRTPVMVQLIHKLIALSRLGWSKVAARIDARREEVNRQHNRWML